MTVKHSGETTLEGWQIIGWDPIAERIARGPSTARADSPKAMTAKATAGCSVRPVWRPTATDQWRHTFTKVSADRFAWESYNRTLDGEPQPSIGGIEINRVKEN